MTTSASETTARAAIKTAIETVSNTGTVYDYLRWAPDYVGLLALFKTTISGVAYYRGFTITCEGMPQTTNEDEGAAYGTRATGNVQTFTYRVRMVYGLNDASATEKSAFTMACDVTDAITAATTAIDSSTSFFGPASLAVFEPRMFGDVLCHYAEITQMVRRWS